MRVLVVSPHPDDMELFCGGAVLQHLSRGDEVVEVLVTTGQLGSVKNAFVRFLGLEGTYELWKVGRKRFEEAKRVASYLGIELKSLGLMDGKVSEHMKVVRRAILKERYDLIYAPDPHFTFYFHPDHIAVGRSLTGIKPVRFYHTTKPNVKVDIRKLRGRKVEIIMCHRSQWHVWGFLLPLSTAGRWSMFSKVEYFREIR